MQNTVGNSDGEHAVIGKSRPWREQRERGRFYPVVFVSRTNDVTRNRTKHINNEQEIYLLAEQGFQIASTVEDADDFAAAFFGQGAVEDQVFGEVRHFPGAEVFGLRAAEGARTTEAGRAGQIFEGDFGAGDEAISQVGIAHVVGVEIPLGEQVGPGGWGRR